MDSKATSVDGITMRWEEDGDGLPLVLVHGIPTGPALWRHVVPRIAGARCLAWEMVGYGASIPEGRARDISVARQAGYLLAWLDSIGIERAVFAGHDLGGGVVQIAAVADPARCAGLFLTNAIGYDSWPIPSVSMTRALGPVVQHLPNVAFKGAFDTFIKRGHDDPARASESINAHWPHYARHDGAAAFIRQIRALNVDDTLSVAGRLWDLRIPARIVWGVRDQFQKIGYGERFARDLGAPLVRIEQGKHFTPEDHPDIVANEINRLLEDVRRAERPGGSQAPAAASR
jgi:pimeloyl-ACP methyl ester carboxylesterase